MSNVTLNWDDLFLEPQEETFTLELPLKENSLALVKDEQPFGHFTIMPPAAVHFLINNNVQVFMQHDFASQSEYSNMDYANVGVEFVDDFFMLTRMARLLVKFQPFTLQQADLMKKKQIIFSSQLVSQATKEYIQTLNAKKIAAFSINFIHNEQGDCVFEEILSTLSKPARISESLSGFLLPLLMNVVYNPQLRFALQKTPALMQAAYCFGGHICNRGIAELLHLPWKDIVSLCWGGN